MSRRDEFWGADALAERKALFARKWRDFLEQRDKLSAKERQAASLIAMAPKLLYDPRWTLSLSEVVKALDNDMDVYLHCSSRWLRNI